MLSPEIDTPAILIERGVMQANLRQMQEFAGRHGVKLRPHVKTHKVPELARMQVALGARGIAVAKLSEAEVMAEAGLGDIQIANQIVGPKKIERLFALAQRARVTCAVDSAGGAEAIASYFAERGQSLPVFIEVDCGLRRAGLSDPAAVLQLARLVTRLEGLRLAGLLTHAGHAYGAKGGDEVERIGAHEGRFLVDLAGALRAQGIEVAEVSVGSTPTARFSGRVEGVTEIRPGNYIFNDLNQVALGIVGLERCALSVLASVISVPAPGRAVIDAGSKSLALDQGAHGSEALKGFGHILDKEGQLTRLSEEHGVVEFIGENFQVGERIRIIPNHACPVMNLLDRAYLVDGPQVAKVLEITARGKSQ